MRSGNELLDLYLRYVEETESPRIFHIWSILSAVSACLGRRCYFDYGVDYIYPNIYVLLVGPPGGKKSTALKLAAKLVAEYTDVRFAPDDTAGQRQGLIVALENKQDDEEEKFKEELGLAEATSLDTLSAEALEKMSYGSIPDPRDKHVLYVAAPEFGSFMGERSSAMLLFLNKMYDGDPYHYKIKNTQNRLGNAQLTIIGATTADDIADMFPPAAIGKGFMSRLILVHGDLTYKDIARPKFGPADMKEQIGETLRKIHKEMEGPIGETEEAANFFNSIYKAPIDINDARFIYYKERRHVHLIKTATLFAAARCSNVIELHDMQEAHALLSVTEKKMPEALGQFGLSPLGAAKQKMIEFLRAADGPVSVNALWAVMHKEMKYSDFTPSLNDLLNAGDIEQLHSKHGPMVVAVDRRKSKDAEIIELLSVKAKEGSGGA